jgi:hypothetical protein
VLQGTYLQHEVRRLSCVTRPILFRCIGSVDESEFGSLKLEAVWGPTALQGLEGEQNVGVATTNGALRLLHASYTLIPQLLENTELILRAACEDTSN